MSLNVSEIFIVVYKMVGKKHMYFDTESSFKNAMLDFSVVSTFQEWSKDFKRDKKTGRRNYVETSRCLIVTFLWHVRLFNVLLSISVARVVAKLVNRSF